VALEIARSVQSHFILTPIARVLFGVATTPGLRTAGSKCSCPSPRFHASPIGPVWFGRPPSPHTDPVWASERWLTAGW